MDRIDALRILGLWVFATLYDIDLAYKKRSKILSPEEYINSKTYKDRLEMKSILDLAKRFLYKEYDGKSEINYYHEWIKLMHQTGLFLEPQKDTLHFEIVVNKEVVKEEPLTPEELKRGMELFSRVYKNNFDINCLSKDETANLKKFIKIMLSSPDFDKMFKFGQKESISIIYNKILDSESLLNKSIFNHK